MLAMPLSKKLPFGTLPELAIPAVSDFSDVRNFSNFSGELVMLFISVTSVMSGMSESIVTCDYPGLQIPPVFDVRRQGALHVRGVPQVPRLYTVWTYFHLYCFCES